MFSFLEDNCKIIYIHIYISYIERVLYIYKNLDFFYIVAKYYEK